MHQMSDFAESVFRAKYSMDGTETWSGTAYRVASNVLGALGYDADSDEVRIVEQLIHDRKFIPGGRYLYASGRPLHQTQNCLLLRADDSREGWSDLWWKAGMALMTGAGIGVDYSDIRERGAPIVSTGGTATGPISLMKSVNEQGRQIVGGGMRRSAIWAGLKWSHPDIHEFIGIKDWDEKARDIKSIDHEYPMPMELTNISIILDDEFFTAYENGDENAVSVFNRAIRRMAKTGEPGFSIDTGVNAGESLRNACTEVTSADDSDICNLGSINLSRINSIGEFAEVMHWATLFLLAGTVYSDLPYPKVHQTREKNRRLGLGLMGVHEWLLQRGKPYAPDSELGDWMDVYATSTDIAGRWAEFHELSKPVKTRAIAPTGTIGIIGETTTGIEPIFCVAMERRWSKGDSWAYDYIIDPTAKRMVDSGVKPDEIEDAYSIGYQPRMEFQSWMQQYVDHGISSTINLPGPITDVDEVGKFGSTLYSQLPHLRGITVYPDGARSGQPLTPVAYSKAVSSALIQESEEKCIGGVCGI